jgi:hypothetical protein
MRAFEEFVSCGQGSGERITIRIPFQQHARLAIANGLAADEGRIVEIVAVQWIVKPAEGRHEPANRRAHVAALGRQVKL